MEQNAKVDVFHYGNDLYSLYLNSNLVGNFSAASINSLGLEVPEPNITITIPHDVAQRWLNNTDKIEDLDTIYDAFKNALEAAQNT